RVALDQRTEENIGNLSRFFRVLPKLPRTDAWALLIGLITLMFGTLLVVAPIVAMAYGFRHGETDEFSCARLDHPGLVVAQFVALATLLAGGLLLWRSQGKAHAFRTCLLLTLLL